MIHGYKQGTNIAAGTRQRITCVSTGGNPPATLTWYKNDKKVCLVPEIVLLNVGFHTVYVFRTNQMRPKCHTLLLIVT